MYRHQRLCESRPPDYRKLYIQMCLYTRTDTRLTASFTGQPGQPGTRKVLMKQQMVWWQWHQLDHTQIICTLLHIGNNASTSSLTFYRLDSLPDAQPTVSKHWRHYYCVRYEYYYYGTSKWHGNDWTESLTKPQQWRIYPACTTFKLLFNVVHPRPDLGCSECQPKKTALQT